MFRRTSFLAILLLLTITFVLLAPTALAAVDLIYFRATPQETSILIEWETATELNNSAFFLYKSESREGPWDQIYAIGAQGDSTTGAYYAFVDNNAAQDMLYWYRLEDLDVNDNSHFQEPIAAGINVETPTPTNTPTQTPTAVPTDATPTATLEFTNTPSPTDTPTYTPQPTTATPPHTPTTAPTTASTATFTPVATATLVPTNTPATISTNTPASTSAPGATPTSSPATVEPTKTTASSTPITDTPTPATTPAQTGASTPIPVLTTTPTPMPPASATDDQIPPPTSIVIFPTPMPEVEESPGSGIQTILLGIGLVALLAAAGLAFYAIRMWRQPPEDQA